MKKNSRLIILIITEIILISLFVVFAGVNNYFVAENKPFAKGKTITIRPGTTVRKAAEILADSSVINSAEDFTEYGRVFGRGKTIKSGVYLFKSKVSPAEAFRVLEKGRSRLVRVTFPEGIRLKDFASILKKKLGKDSLKFMRLASSPEKLAAFGINAPNLEGFLLPETYMLNPLDDEETILDLLVKNALKIYEENKTAYQKKNLSLLQVATIASLVEGECQLDEERPIVASVYYNRLKRRMKLQADPTIQFLLKDGPRRLLHKDLKIDSPYNTYMYRGLPPGPINNPGKASILAAIYPAETDFLYFVARGDGGHYFAETWNQHVKNKKKFDKIRRQVAWERRKNGG